MERTQKMQTLTTAIVCTILLGHPVAGLAQAEQPMAAWGQDLFLTYCAVCHGTSGKGDGPMATALKTPPADLTQISKQHDGSFPRAQIMGFIDGERPIPAHGPREMPIWGEEFRREKTDPEARMRIFALASFIKSIQEE